MISILMVCLGNICRSPLAEVILKSKLPKNKFVVDSAGTSDFHNGNAPDKRSIDVAIKYGLDISNQKSRPFTIYDFKKFDHIFAMDKSNYKNIIKHAQNDIELKKVSLILEYPNSKIKEVPDPYFGGNYGFENVYKLLEDACDYHSQKLIKAL